MTILGAPRVVQTPVGPAIEFNGSTDGVFLDANPLESIGNLRRIRTVVQGGVVYPRSRFAVGASPRPSH